MKKLGATPSDRAYIKRRAAAGISAEIISDECNVIVSVVKNFMPVEATTDDKTGRAGTKASTSRKTPSRAKSKAQKDLNVEPEVTGSEAVSEAASGAESDTSRVRA